MSAKRIELGVFGIEITFQPKKKGSGVVSSDLHAQLVDENDAPHIQEQLSTAADALESLVLAHAMAGIDVTTPAYKEGIEVAVQSIANNVQ